MSQLRTVIEAWPALLTEEMAARYISIELTSFQKVAARMGLQSVEVEEGVVRWRKGDLDHLVKRLRSVPAVVMQSAPVGSSRFSDVEIEKIAAAVAQRLGGSTSRPQAALVSIKDACALLGVARTTIYRMINDGEFVPRHIGRRTLIPMSQIQALLDGSA